MVSAGAAVGRLGKMRERLGRRAPAVSSRRLGVDGADGTGPGAGALCAQRPARRSRAPLRTLSRGQGDFATQSLYNRDVMGRSSAHSDPRPTERRERPAWQRRISGPTPGNCAAALHLPPPLLANARRRRPTSPFPAALSNSGRAREDQRERGSALRRPSSGRAIPIPRTRAGMRIRSRFRRREAQSRWSA